MKKLKCNTTTQYEPQNVTGDVSIHFRKEDNGNISVYGSIVKNESEIGLVSYSQVGNTLSVHVKRVSEISKEELSAIYNLVPGCLDQILNEVNK